LFDGGEFSGVGAGAGGSFELGGPFAQGVEAATGPAGDFRKVTVLAEIAKDEESFVSPGVFAGEAGGRQLRVEG